MSGVKVLSEEQIECYKKLLFDKDILYSDIQKALEMVRAFIAKKKLILLGGQALDYALRAKGGAIYGTNVIPDYDFLSPNHYKDAIELGNSLCDAGISSVNIIFGMHLTTMRVRVYSVGVADITYCPSILIKEIPSIKYQELIIIDPISQMIDQHRALCYGYESPSFGGTADRWPKDMSRYLLVREYYDIPKKGIKLSPKSVTLPIGLLKGTAIAGYAAHAVIENRYSATKKDITFNIRHNVFQMFSDDYIKHSDALAKHLGKKTTLYNAYMGRLPKSTQFTAGGIVYIVYDNLGSYLAAKPFNDMHLVSAQFSLMYYMHCGDYESYNQLIEMSEEITPIATYYGSLNRGDNLQHSMDTFEDNNRRSDVPKNLYPEDGVCNVMGEFLYESEYFQIDGQPTK